MEKRCLKRSVAASKWHLNRNTRTKVVEAPSLTLMAVISHCLTSFLGLLKDDSTHGLTEVNSNVEELPKRATSR